MITTVPDGAVFQALASATRRQILRELKAGEPAAGEIAERFPIWAPSISRHLAVLRTAGPVVERREGNRVLYRLQERRLLSALRDVLSAVCPAQAIIVRQERRRRGRA
ncbi:MAG TPA: metalloregulator ArsR/SmtB family transcription factor [Candidatus Dormibacteraeota bacterium]|nr:metalloregulator ArsR/SmtB family transcription factor [Candidatus Dormibacteraeota bacterium]